MLASHTPIHVLTSSDNENAVKSSSRFSYANTRFDCVMTSDLLRMIYLSAVRPRFKDGESPYSFDRAAYFQRSVSLRSISA